jgi:hypothetical protein
MFLNVTAFNGYPSQTPNFENVFKMQNLSLWTMDESCFKAYPSEEHKCFFAEHVLPHVSTPIFIAQSMVDAWEMEYLLELPCFQRTGNLSNCSEVELKAVQQFSSEIASALQPALDGNSVHGLWADSCLIHGGQDVDFMFSKALVEGQTMRETFDTWFFKNHRQFKSKVLDNFWPNGCKSN